MYIALIKTTIAHHVLSLTVSEEILKLSLSSNTMTLAGNIETCALFLSCSVLIEKPKIGVTFVLQEVNVTQYCLYIALKTILMIIYRS